jgi:hypothetical protein
MFDGAVFALTMCIWGAPQSTAAQANAAGVLATDILAIDAGGSGIANWKPDAGSPDYTLRSKVPVITAGIRNPAPQSVYGSQRFFDGTLVYSLAGLRPQTAYTVRMHFAEFVANARGERIFNVSVNGRQVCTNLDVFAAAGGKFHALVERFAATADTTGQIGISLTPVRGSPIINGVEIQRLSNVRFAALTKASR